VHDGIVPLIQVHGYSGEWVIENRFTLWRDCELGKDDAVYFHGKAFLLLSADGKRGFGTQIGQAAEEQYRQLVL
jgi:hypothetical protein